MDTKDPRELLTIENVRAQFRTNIKHDFISWILFTIIFLPLDAFTLYLATNGIDLMEFLGVAVVLSATVSTWIILFIQIARKHQLLKKNALCLVTDTLVRIEQRYRRPTVYWFQNHGKVIPHFHKRSLFLTGDDYYLLVSNNIKQTVYAIYSTKLYRLS